ncbi:unnamed protein product [Cylicocyclus nassatus]|uniref:Fungal lipase-type domain-containing protein n=1 Tax=Cylicocyclus nassatus TaxID=53992 RepID=A0AA36GRK7_CYLNA|nr:unnamed protein product [Cylicocyclus nassatus]
MFGLIATLSLLVVGAQPQADSFSHNFAQNSMLPLAAAAYSDNPGACVRNRFGRNAKVEVVRFYKTNCNGPINIGKVYCVAYTALLHGKEKAIVLSFRGTEDGWQLSKQLFHPLLSKEWFGGASVNTYFLHSFNSVFHTRMNRLTRSSMYEDARELIRKYPTYDIWITGHSLGGALASLAASYLLETGTAPRSKTKLITFGQPRTGDGIFAERLNNKIDYAFRVIHDNDMVPHIPPNLPTLFGKLRYHHHKKEVYYGRNMRNGFKVCNTENDSSCSGRYSFLRTIDVNEEARQFSWKLVRRKETEPR